MFPEIDMASKVAAESDLDSSQNSSPLAKLLSPLSDSASSEIRKSLARAKFILYYPNISGPLVLSLEGRGFPLSRTRNSRPFIE
jgi:hypothetical protein